MLYLYLTWIFISFHYHFIICDELKTTTRWIGKSGNWNEPKYWNTGVLPDRNSLVIINTTRNDIIIIQEPVSVYSLLFSGGTIQISGKIISL